MELQTISMPVEEAHAAFRDYRDAVRRTQNEEDRAIMRGYKALAAGLSLIKLTDTVRAGGWEERSFRRGTATVTGLPPMDRRALEPAPVDPALLKHIGGDLWAVMAVWDLTELERAVLSGRVER